MTGEQFVIIVIIMNYVGYRSFNNRNSSFHSEWRKRADPPRDIKGECMKRYLRWLMVFGLVLLAGCGPKGTRIELTSFDEVGISQGHYADFPRPVIV